MRNEPNLRIEAKRVIHGPQATDASYGNNGVFVFENPYDQGKLLFTICSDCGGWEHVSVTVRSRLGGAVNRCPTWEELSWIKQQFWTDDETVLQFHPKSSEYVNHHPYCLHLWKETGKNATLPPSIFIGPNESKRKECV